MQKLFIGIPILNREDLLAQCLDTIDYPAEIVVVNNSVDSGFTDKLNLMAEEKQITILHQERNLGVAASWNVLIRKAFAQGHDLICIGSNDTALHPGSLKAAVEAPNVPNAGILHLDGFNFFLLPKQTIELVGWFDENFYPAYEEDHDYAYRCHLAGLLRFNVPGAGAHHVGSATINSNPEYAWLNQDTHINWNLTYYRRKWGGLFGYEQYRHPFNNPAYDLRWWSPPGEEVALRDWDSTIRLGTGTVPEAYLHKIEVLEGIAREYHSLMEQLESGRLFSVSRNEDGHLVVRRLE